MSRQTRFVALRQRAEDESNTSIEMLSSSNLDRDHDRDRTHQWGQTHGKMTFWDKFSPFPWKAFLIVSTLPLALAPIIVLATAAERASTGYIWGRDCYPNGMWKLAEGATWRIMDSSYFFTPNLSFGAMTFTQVKVIDIAWDLIIGRGGQILLAWVNYRVFNEWLVYHMEMHLTSYKMYTAIAFETTSLTTLGVLAKEFLAFGESNWKRFFRWLAVLSMLLSTLYVLSFPTLMAAMTGYIATYQAYVEDFDHNLIEWRKFTIVYAVIEDANRIEYERPLVVSMDDNDIESALLLYMHNNSLLDPPAYQTTMDGTDIFTYQKNESSVWSFEDSQISLDSPTLNVTLYNAKLRNQPSPGLGYPYYSYEGRQGNIYNASYIFTHGSCKPSETYQWGFSYIFLFMVAIFDFVWSCIMVGMWLDTRRSSRMYKSGRRPGLLRSIIDISGAIREELSGSDLDAMEEDELRRRLRESGGALLVPKQELKVSRTGTGEFGAPGCRSEDTGLYKSQL
ncbi:hypothetical protein BS50DRAFT_677478 [Corynespora cassiicola Philippines]|uniref:Uncharacterized protein n=1 Tax=Corynespora cassiicola Philippines TaxID=1448308 RepID=A0A2T2NLC6_CORCC|nr:hypothetical protein BS50DRAFT_677478 [Corynespora cassiicola Philippines]